MSGRVTKEVLKVPRQQGTTTKRGKRVRFADQGLKQDIHFEAFILSMKELLQQKIDNKIHNKEKVEDAKIKE